MDGLPFLRLMVAVVTMVVPIVVLYFTIKLAVKNAIRELKDEGFI